MPFLSASNYRPGLLFKNAHIQTIYPPIFRKVKNIRYERERIFTPDHDFIDLDWSRVGGDKVVIVLHGLEGHSRRSYMLGMISAFNMRRWDAVALNFRGCSGQPNRRLRSYHCGATDDLHTVLRHVMNRRRYTCISLVGFSVGGNLALMYLGEKKYPVSPLIKSAAAVSVPCDLESCANKLAQRSNILYMKRFLMMFHDKIRMKMRMMPNEIDDANYHLIRTFKDFDDRYTAPIHGFSNAKDYWNKCSCKQFLPGIDIPVLLISARDDPFLGKECYPVDEAKGSRLFYFEMPDHGGHVGFIDFKPSGEYWHEKRIAAFVTKKA
ncbi:MAG: alpha/beta fold hydrolase [Desulfobacterales bacterium]